MYKIQEAEMLANNIYRMVVEAPRVAQHCLPGQFVIVKADEEGERIPLTICDYDREAGTITIVFMPIGESTKKMKDLKAGDAFMDFVGPLGQPSEFCSEDIEELKKKKNNREAAISILRGISIRMPLLIYGAELKDESQEITIDNFASLIDPQSWEEFMPKGVTKQKFNNIKKYYDPEIFCAAGKRIRAMARAADKLSVEERIERITDIFSTFRNPDKETVLTPWRVVNMHLGDCLGGYNFFEQGYETTLSEPRFIDKGEVTANVFAEDSRILEINSKSGLYPLYMAYSIYRTRVKNSLFSVSSIEDEQQIWDKVVAENIFVICKTPMAKSITKRTLIGFRKAKVNTRYFEDLINQIKNKPEHFIKQVDKFVSERTGIKNMKFNAIVGNPPYQVMDGGAQASSVPVYQYFVSIAKKVQPNFISMIMPARWYAGGRGLDDFRADMLSDKTIRSLHDYPKASDLFSNVGSKVDYAIS